MDIKRIIELKLQNLIKGIGAVVIAGPKYCGKTYLGNKYSKSSFSYQDISEEEKLTLTNSAVLEGDKPSRIDENQISYTYIITKDSLDCNRIGPLFINRQWSVTVEKKS